MGLNEKKSLLFFAKGSSFAKKIFYWQEFLAFSRNIVGWIVIKISSIGRRKRIWTSSLERLLF